MKRTISILLGLGLWMACAAGHAAVTCTITPSAVLSASYAAGAPVVSSRLMDSVAVSCTRTSADDPATLNYTFNPMMPGVMTALLGGNALELRYFVDGNCSVAYTSGSGTLSMPAVGIAVTQTHPYWLCVSSVQSPTAFGTYSYSPIQWQLFESPVNMLKATSNPGSVNVNVTSNVGCTVNPAPSSITINYRALDRLSSASTGFGVNCTAGAAYTMALSPASGTLLGINYSLALSAVAAAGNGALQLYSITATAPAGQTGSCTGTGCAASQVHTLTVSY
jgi:hypothetical protein